MSDNNNKKIEYLYLNNVKNKVYIFLDIDIVKNLPRKFPHFSHGKMEFHMQTYFCLIGSSI